MRENLVTILMRETRRDSPTTTFITNPNGLMDTMPSEARPMSEASCKDGTSRAVTSLHDYTKVNIIVTKMLDQYDEHARFLEDSRT